ncbi:MAG: nuclear transport factor 2 family protein [Planctomycetota bacterium]
MPLSALDRLEIQDLCARYYVSTDEKDVDGFMDCWVEDDDITFNSAFGNFQGRAAIREFEDEHVHRGMAIGKRHLLGNVIIRPGELPNQALVTTYMVVMEVVDVPHIVATAIYRDSVAEKTAQGWRFRSRSMDVDPGFQKLMEGNG